jgi:hypothetical protein
MPMREISFPGGRAQVEQRAFLWPRRVEDRGYAKLPTATHRNQHPCAEWIGTTARNRNFSSGACRYFQGGIMGQLDHLPSRFPDGTRYVIEGREGRILLRYLEFPDGRHVDLPTNRAGVAPAARSGSAALRKRSAKRSRK